MASVEMLNFLTGKDAIILFYGVYMTAVINLIRKYRTFDLYLLLSKDKARKTRSTRRFMAGFIIIDVMPVSWFLVLYLWVIPDSAGPFPIMAAAFASLSVLAFARLLHSVIATEKYDKFYSPEEYQIFLGQWGRENDDDNTFLAHFLTGVSYLLIFPLIAYVIGRISF